MVCILLFGMNEILPCLVDYGIQRWLRYSHGGQGLRGYSLGFASWKSGTRYLIRPSEGNTPQVNSTGLIYIVDIPHYRPNLPRSARTRN